MLSLLFTLLLISQTSFSISASTRLNQFIKCVSTNLELSIPLTVTLFSNSSRIFALHPTVENLRFTQRSVPKPEFIFTPLHDTHVSAAVFCATQVGIHIRVRSGGHDFEGLSSTSHFITPFAIIDLVNLRSVEINITNDTAWIQAGATIGEVYYKIAQKSRVRGFPAGTCPSVGIGGHITGGAYGSLVRKYGLAADNVVDARIVDVNGRILDRESMGEDLFWAIRGGAGGSFGIILWWKIKLVPVPETVTVFKINRTLEQGATKLLYKWQQIASKLDEDLFMEITMTAIKRNGGRDGRSIISNFKSLFLGRSNRLVKLLEKSFPELELTRNDCTEMSWIDSVVFIAGYPRGTALEVLLSEKTMLRAFFKVKSDYVKVPIPETGMKGLWAMMLKEDHPALMWTAFGGKMSKISAFEIPYPHRNGIIFMIQYTTAWLDGEENQEKHMNWIKKVYDYMTPYVSSNPRQVYVNYRDLDLGMNKDRNVSVKEASVWGTKYFKQNFYKLARVKGKVDPNNFFWHEQSIPVSK